MDQKFYLGEVVDAIPPSPDNPTSLVLSIELEAVEALHFLNQADFHSIPQASRTTPVSNTLAIDLFPLPQLPPSRDFLLKPIVSALCSEKVKGKVLAHYAFNNDGLLCKEAIRILDEGSLGRISKVFSKSVIDLDEEISNGIYAKDVLEAAVNGSLNVLLGTINSKKHSLNSSVLNLYDLPQQSEKNPKQPLKPVGTVLDQLQAVPNLDTDLMDVEQVLLEMAMFEEAVMNRLP